MNALPGWLYQLIKLAITVGSPYLLKAIQGWIKNLPADVIQIINDLIKSLTQPNISNSIARKTARNRLKQCQGVGCPPEVKES